MLKFVPIISLLMVSCLTQQNQTKSVVQSNSQVNAEQPETNSVNVADELIESFSDDSNVGVPKKNKIEVFNFKKANGSIAQIKFYSLAENKEWKLKQTFEYEKDDFSGGCDPKIEDFNNDGLKDMTYVSASAARGANEIRKLFIYDKKKDELVYIKNSEEYPNLAYNKKLDCIDAMAFYGGTATEFLKLEGDMLRVFATVETVGNERKVYLINKSGKQKLLRTEKVNADDEFTRYSTFNPPRP